MTSAEDGRIRKPEGRAAPNGCYDPRVGFGRRPVRRSYRLLLLVLLPDDGRTVFRRLQMPVLEPPPQAQDDAAMFESGSGPVGRFHFERAGHHHPLAVLFLPAVLAGPVLVEDDW